ncbi:MAG: hypothetical protein ABIT76_08335 [Chthoniobacterales bacterium]
MKREEAEFILTAYRPGGEDASDAGFAEALQMAANDPELGQWLAREQEMDRLVCEKLSRVPVPSGLRDRILAGGRVSRKPVWCRRRGWMALAAALLIFALVGGWRMMPVDGRNLPEFAMNYASRGFLLEAHNKDLTQLENWLAARQMPTPEAVPERLAALEKLGCRTVSYHGRPVSIICFEKDGREYHLFVAKKIEVGSFTAQTSRQTQGNWSAIAWSDATNDYVLASKIGLPALERLL